MKNFNQILPTEIISEILTRLPTESVLECKLVCKTWNNLIQHPRFPKLHLARLNHPDSTPDSGKLRYVFLDEEEYGADRHLCCFEFNENEDWNHAKPIHKKIMLETINCEDYILIGSFNGLICFYRTLNYSYDVMIMNPVTREYIVLPDFDKYTRSKSISYQHLGCGFGYLAETNEYTVVRIYKVKYVGEPNVLDVVVYTLGSGKGWRHVGKFDLGFGFYPLWGQQQGVFLNGCLHWRNKEGGMVVVFDLANEKFRDHIPPPPMLMEPNEDDDDDDDDDDFSVIGVSGGGILYYAACQFDEGEKYDEVWLLMKKDDNHVMRGQEEQQSWVWSQPDSLEQTEPFAFKEQDSVLRYDQGNIKEFCSENSTWTNLGGFSEISLQVFPHKHTLISLKDLGEDVEILKTPVMETDSSESDSEETYSSESGSD